MTTSRGSSDPKLGVIKCCKVKLKNLNDYPMVVLIVDFLINIDQPAEATHPESCASLGDEQN